MEKIRYLKPQEKQETRPMYEKVFPEDSEEFVDYYYEWKTRENEILVMEESETLQVMAHLNPYTLWINGHLRNLPYIVAVATDPDCRRQGKMGRVMERVLQDLEKQQVPFTFLLPADPAYYHGQGFVFFPSQDFEKTTSLRAAQAEDFPGECAGKDESFQPWCTSKPEGFPGECAGKDKSFWPWRASKPEPLHGKDTAGKSRWEFQWQKAELADIPEMVEFSNNILEERYHIFVKRDAHYYQRMFAETKTEHGGILLLRPRDEAMQQESAMDKAELGLKGILVYGVEQQKAEIQEFLLKADDPGQRAWCRNALPGLEIAFSEFPMMLRITNLREFVSLMRHEKPCCYDVKIRDGIIPSHCGCYRIELSKDGGRMHEIPEKEIKKELDIRELAKELLKDTCVYLKEWV